MSSFFFGKRTSNSGHVDGPEIHDVKITMENLCLSLQDEMYIDGVDAETMCNTLTDVYKWLTGTLGQCGISLPAPANDPDDRHRSMWPEGAKVTTRSRRGSRSSHVSRSSKGIVVPNINAAYTSSRASSTTSSRYAPVRARFIEDEYPEEAVRTINLRDVRASAPVRRREPEQHPVRHPPRPFRTETLSPEMPVQRAPVNFRGNDFDDEVEHIDTRSSQQRQQPKPQRDSSASARRTKMPVFVEDD